MKAIQGTPSWLRQTNDRTALDLLLSHGPLTRNQLGKLSGLSKPTASQMIVRLEAAGLVEPAGEVSAGRGPSATIYGVRADRVIGIGIEINAEAVRSTAVTVDGREHPVSQLVLPRLARERDPVTDVRTAIDAACALSGLPQSAVKTVCIGIPGALDARTDKLAFAASLPAWPRKGVRALLEDALHATVTIDNDVNLAAIAERDSGATTTASSFALLWMGDGLGLATDIGGAVQRGASGGAGEIGYLPISREAVSYVPEAHTLQDLIGGPAVVRLARAHGIHGRTYAQIIEALSASTPHPARMNVLKDLAPRIAVGVIPALAVLDPESVVLGGPLGSAGGNLLASLVRNAVRQRSRWNPTVLGTAVTSLPVLRGIRNTLLADVHKLLLSAADSPTP